MEAADPVGEEEPAPADHSRNAVIESLPMQAGVLFFPTSATAGAVLTTANSISADQPPSLATARSALATAGITISTWRLASTRVVILASKLGGVLSADQAVPTAVQGIPRAVRGIPRAIKGIPRASCSYPSPASVLPRAAAAIPRSEGTLRTIWVTPSSCQGSPHPADGGLCTAYRHA